MKFKVRYKIWQVAVGMISVALIGFLLYILVNGGFPEQEKTARPKNPNANPESGWRTLHDFLFYVMQFYVVINLYYNLIAANKKILWYLKISALIISGVLGYVTMLYYFFPFVLHNKHETPFSVYRAIFGSLIPILIVSFIVAYITYVRESLKQRRILEAQKLQLEAQISQANFNFLKAQINPHFLHNTLNFLYAKSLPHDPELSEGILTLSDIMRYALDQGYQKNGKAPLKDEIEHVNNVIKISQLRFSHSLNVKFDVTGNTEGAFIIPFVLITLVENAFKHGDLKSREHPIDIRLNVKNNRLYFYCRNKKKTGGAKQLSTGIGLENIRKRLELAYGTNFSFIVNDEADFYTTELTINEL